MMIEAMAASRAALDKRQARRAFSRWRAADSPAAIAAERLWERVGSMAQRPAIAADIGGDGAFLAARYPMAKVLALDFAPPALAAGAAGSRVCADAEALPLAAGALPLVWSNLCAEWTECRRFFAEAARVLKTDGLFAFTTLGPDTLREMRAVFDGEGRVHDFADMHDLGDALLAAGFAEPIMESERLTFTYAAAADALTEARRLGGGNALAGRTALTKSRWRRALDDYTRHFADADGRVHATYEVIYATAWRAPPRQDAEGFAPLRFLRR